jgi:transcriptional regulator with XRE-family HTH domain
VRVLGVIFLVVRALVLAVHLPVIASLLMAMLMPSDPLVDLFSMSYYSGCLMFSEMLTGLAHKNARRQPPVLIPPFSPLEVNRLFLSPDWYTVSVNYPNLGAEEIVRIYTEGGVLTFSDVGYYLHETRLRRETTVSRIARVTNQSASVISRIEAGDLERIKLKDILLLEGNYAGNGIISGMFLRAAQFYSLIPSQIRSDNPEWYTEPINISGYDIVKKFLAVCRNFQLITEGDYSWLESIRHRIYIIRSNQPP